jgi:DNA-binding PadR family transcriptional regulator
MNKSGLLTRTEELILWSIIRLKENAYCVPIRDTITGITGEKWPLGSIYMPLDRLVKNGYLVSHLSDSTPERGGRRKRIYRLTPEGLAALEKTRDVQHKMWGSMPAKWKES